MKAKLGAALLCLVFAIPFGGIGAGASWVLGRMIYDGQRAQDWVRVKATVDSYDRRAGSVSYRYLFDGVEHRGDRLGANPIGGTDDVDSWHDGMAAAMAAAQDGSKPLTVWVNPDNPSESMVDRTIRWKLAAFVVPFAFGFGGVGLVALWIFLRTLVRPAAEVEADVHPVAVLNSKPGSGIAFLWMFAFFWNVISFPIALVVVPDALAQGEWAALLVLLFPLIGVLLLWGAIHSTIKAIRGKFAPAPVQRVVAPRPANDGVFARGMLGDAPAVPRAKEKIEQD